MPTARIVAFLRDLGLDVEIGAVPPDSFLPGLTLVGGALRYDPARLHPGDLLHEAGHLALTPADRRDALRGELPRDGGEELAVIAWAWAAGVALGLSPDEVFHPGYGRDGDSLRAAFVAGQHPGAPLLAWYGLTALRPDPADPDAAVYPAMRAWLRA